MSHFVYCAIQPPYLPAYHGGEVRDAHLLSDLIGRGEVDFFALYHVFDAQRSPIVKKIHTPESYHRKWAVAMWKMARGLRFKRWYGEVDQLWHRSRALAPVLNRILRLHPPEFLLISPQVNPLLLMAQPVASTRTILVSSDVEQVRMQRWGALTARVGEFERRSLAKLDGIIAVSALDAQIYAETYAFPSERILVIESGIDAEYFAFQEPALEVEPLITFIGSLNYPPNGAAAERLIRRIMPLVWAALPQASCWIVGQNPSDSLKRLHDGQRVHVTGWVEDVRPLMRQAAVTCIPLESGSGIKVKVLEAFSSGLAVVGTPLALEGIVGGDHALIGNTDDELARHILHLLKSPQARIRQVRAARQVSQAHYQWRNNLRRLDTWLPFIQKL